jgi:hypothetical protein
MTGGLADDRQLAQLREIARHERQSTEGGR